MREYGYGALMNDYVYLEDVGRAVASFGADIVRARLAPQVSAPVAARSMRGGGGMRGRGRGGGKGSGYMSKAETRRHAFRRQMELWDVEVDLLPSEMAKAKLNRSMWDYKCVLANVSLCFLLPFN
jgi:hypothetical protein